MFDKLFDFIFEFLDLFRFWQVIDAYEEGVVLRWGKFYRVVNPGFRWLIPFGVDRVITNNVVPCAMTLRDQSLVSKDEHHIVLSAILMWKIFDIRRCILDVEDAEETLADIAVGYIQEAVEATNWADIRTPEFRRTVKKAIQRTARDWGITVYSVKFGDLTDAKTLRLLGVNIN